MTANQSSDAFSRQRRLQPSDADDNADGLLVSAMMDTPTGIPMGILVGTPVGMTMRTMTGRLIRAQQIYSLLAMVEHMQYAIANKSTLCRAETAVLHGMQDCISGR